MDLSHNQLASLGGAFSGLTHLSTLRLAHNQIPPRALPNLVLAFGSLSLRRLDLYGNPLALDESYPDELLRVQPKLIQLDHVRQPAGELAAGGSGGAVARRSVAEAIDAVAGGARLVILSDASFGEGLDSSKRLYVPPLVMTGATHHALIGAGLRLKGSILVETAQVWSTHHVATLCGYGASAVHPYMLFRVAAQLTTPPKEGKKPKVDGVTPAEGVANARAALKTGVLKIMSKIGISALSSYHGAQIFECVGLHPEVVDVAFKGTASRLGGLDFEELEKEVKSMVNSASYEIDDDDLPVFKLANFGFINALQKGRGGEEHANSPKVAKLLHAAVREDDEAERKIKYDAFAAALREDSPFGLRDLMTLKYACLLYTSPSPRDATLSRMPSSA